MNGKYLLIALMNFVAMILNWMTIIYGNSDSITWFYINCGCFFVSLGYTCWMLYGASNYDEYD